MNDEKAKTNIYFCHSIIKTIAGNPPHTLSHGLGRQNLLHNNRLTFNERRYQLIKFFNEADCCNQMAVVISIFIISFFMRW